MIIPTKTKIPRQTLKKENQVLKEQVANLKSLFERLELDEFDQKLMYARQIEELKKQRDAALELLANWCIAVDLNGSNWDDWEEWYHKATKFVTDTKKRLAEEKGLIINKFGFAEEKSTI